MKAVAGVLVGGFLGVAILFGSDAFGQALPGRVRCTPPHAMRIQDLDVRPDPVRPGQAIREWIVTLKSDRTGECMTLLQIKDRDQLAGADIEHAIKPGTNKYRVKVVPGYKFQAQDHCFTVLADIAGTRQPIDAAKRFCARQLPMWTLK